VVEDRGAGQAVQHHQAQTGTAGLLVHAHGLAQRGPQPGRVRRGQAHAGQHGPVQRAGLAVETPGQPGQFGDVDHADGNRVPVPEPVPLHPLDGVAEGVPVVQDLPQARLVQVLRHHLGLDSDGALDELARVRAVRDGGPLGVGSHQVEDDRVGDEPRLDDFGQAGHVVLAGQRLERDQVGEHPGRRVERADQVLACCDVDGGLAAHRGVGHGEQRGRDQDHADAAEPGRGDEPGQVGGRSAADADHAVGPGDAVRGQPGPQPGRDLDGLGRLAVGHRLGVHGQARGSQCAARGAGDLAEAGGVDDHDGAGAGGNQAGQFAEHPDADHHLVGRAAVRRGDVDSGRGHLVILAAICSASSPGSKSSVGTVTAASRW